jgi:hypothetical protein
MVIHNATQLIGFLMMCIGAGGLGQCFHNLVNPE